MELQELIRLNENVSITVSLNDLKKFADYIIEKTKSDLEKVVISDKAEYYLTPKQVSEMLGVNLSTLWRYAKRSYLVPIEVGGKRRYRMSDIRVILNAERVSK